MRPMDGFFATRRQRALTGARVVSYSSAMHTKHAYPTDREPCGRAEETKRLARILQIITWISSAPRRWTRAALSDRLGISERLADKDLQIIRRALRRIFRWGTGCEVLAAEELPAIVVARRVAICTGGKRIPRYAVHFHPDSSISARVQKGMSVANADVEHGPPLLTSTGQAAIDVGVAMILAFAQRAGLPDVADTDLKAGRAQRSAPGEPYVADVP